MSLRVVRHVKSVLKEYPKSYNNDHNSWKRHAKSKQSLSKGQRKRILRVIKGKIR